ncbi:hypothetical protein ACRN9A_21715 [Shewanella frigidimarina]|uniref:hypothetical protein n=1 Tax=Shewanella frigidimarina TaxID=56812 RepID=UPI003D78C2D9
MAFEKPAEGNPHKFVIKQHFHTAHSIAKFHDTDCKLDVFIKDSGEALRRHSRSSIFCARRNWDEKSEKGLMANIEQLFHQEINEIKPFELRNHSAISEYFMLWKIRYDFHISRMDDAVLNGISGSGLTKEQEEILESKGYSFVRDGGVVPARFMTGIQVLRQLDMNRPGMQNMKWGLLKAKEGEFIVADSYNDLAFMPISPILAFCAGSQDMQIDKADVTNANRQSIEKSREFYFARDLSKCPFA